MGRNKLILFGAGRNGILALKKYGIENVAYFCDNLKEKQGTTIKGIKVLSFDEMMNLYKDGYTIMITPTFHTYLIGELESEGVDDYLIFQAEESRFPFDDKKERFEYENRILDKLAEESSKIDLLADVSEFAKVSKEALRMNREENLSLMHRGMKGESDFYGNLQTIMNYAGISENDRKYFPIVSHQDCMPIYTPAFQYKTAVIMSGKYYRRKIHERAPYVPVFSIGPYIYYAESIYSQQELQYVKEKTGRMLLAFLPHSIESVKRKFDRNDFIDSLIREYKIQFECIWLCVYWADINDSVCEYARDRGIHVVTAGFRFDSKFNQRLKTILELADAVVCGDIGTFISYALLMNKPIGRLRISNDDTIIDGELKLDLEKKLQLTKDYKIFKEKFYILFDRKLKNTKEQKEWMSDVAGFNQVRDKEYIKRIFEISRDIWNMCRCDLKKYPEAVRKVYDFYEESYEFDKMAILKTAVGSYVD